MNAEAPRRGVRITPIPPFEQWVTSRPEFGVLNEPTQRHLHAIVSNKDATVIRLNGELRRICRVPIIDVFYKTPDKTYKLKETGYKIHPGRNIDDVLGEVKEGNFSGVQLSRQRDNGNSLSERSKLNGEKPKDAMVRAVMEEMFGEVNLEEYVDLKNLVRDNLIPGERTRSDHDAYHKDNSIKGLPVTYLLHPAEITFTPDMHVPIDVVDGVPQTLYEKEEGKYINIFTWVEVENDTQPRVTA